MNEGHDLVGMKISDVEMTTDSKALRFIPEDGEPVVAKVDGDCCSNTWIESLDAPEVLRGATVVSVENLDLHDHDEEQDWELIQHYGCKITTERGSCVIDYRNSSNGYYGGNLHWPSDRYHYGGVYGQNDHNDEWRSIYTDTDAA